MLAVPVEKQFEQILNARALEKEGYGLYAEELTEELLAEFIRRLPEFEKNLAGYSQDGNRALLEKLEEVLQASAGTGPFEGEDPGLSEPPRLEAHAQPAAQPLAIEAQPVAGVPAGAGAGTRARARILVVDDEPMVGLAVERALRTEHEVTLTQSAREALRRIQAGERFDLMLCDVMMPEMTGIELEAAVRAIDEAQSERMVFLTGGAFTKATQEFLERMKGRVLEKPFGVGDLRAYVSRKVNGEAVIPSPAE